MAVRTLSGLYLNTVDLTTAADNPLRILATALISPIAGDGIDGIGTMPFTVMNAGIVKGAGGNGINLLHGGLVQNRGNATITGTTGISLGASGTVRNTGIVQGSTTGVQLSTAGTVVNGANSSTGAVISGGKYGVRAEYSTYTTIQNFGTIAAQAWLPGYHYGAIFLPASLGASITNGSATDTTATIAASGNGVEIDGSSGFPVMVSIKNFGTIQSAHFYGIRLGPHATIVNASIVNGSVADTKALINGGSIGIYSTNVYRTTVQNFGTVSGGVGVRFDGAGAIVNGTNISRTALIEGNSAGIRLGFVSSPVKISNFGTIESYGPGTGIVGGAFGQAWIVNGSAADTSALIQGSQSGIAFGAAFTVANFGTIQSSGLSSHGVYAGGTAVVTNGAKASTAALILGYTSGVTARGAATITNCGTIEAVGNSSTGVALTGGGTLQNGLVGASMAYITGGAYGVKVADLSAAVTNLGSIGAQITTSRGVYLLGGRLTNGSTAATTASIQAVAAGVQLGNAGGEIVNYGTISGIDCGIYITDGGSVINGSPGSTTALITGSSSGIAAANAPATISNYGTILAVGDNIILSGGGAVTNAASGTISVVQGNAVFVSGGAVVNFGSVSGGTDGVSLANSGTLSNSGSITGPVGVNMFEGGGFDNRSGGMIAGSDVGAGLVLDLGVFSATNSGTISGGIGVEVVGITGSPGALSAIATLTNAGTITGTGGTAVWFRDNTGGNLIVEQGAVFNGAVLGGGKATLSFTTPGVTSLTGFSGFQTIRLAPGGGDSLVLTDDALSGIGGVATVYGGNAGNVLDASAVSTFHIDALVGGGGNDVLTAGASSTLTGGAGFDQFVFTGTGSNTVSDFVHGIDKLVFRAADFDLGIDNGLGTATPQKLAATLFSTDQSGAMQTAANRFSFKASSRQLLYSPSGSSGTPTLVATLNGASAVTANDLYFVA